MSGNYFPNNWEAWAEMPEEFLLLPHGKSLKTGSCVDGNYLVLFVASSAPKTMVESKSMSTKSNTPPKNSIRQLMNDGAEFTVCTEDELRHITPITTDDYE